MRAKALSLSEADINEAHFQGCAICGVDASPERSALAGEAREIEKRSTRVELREEEQRYQRPMLIEMTRSNEDNEEGISGSNG
jgi:hypothetical protein